MLSKMLFNSLLHLLLAYRYIYICNRFQSQCAESFRNWLIALERWKLYPAVLCLLSSLTYWQQTEKGCAGGLAASVAVVSNKFIIQFECSRQHLPYFSPTPFTCGYLSCQLATQCLQQLLRVRANDNRCECCKAVEHCVQLAMGQPLQRKRQPPLPPPSLLTIFPFNSALFAMQNYRKTDANGIVAITK